MEERFSKDTKWVRRKSRDSIFQSQEQRVLDFDPESGAVSVLYPGDNFRHWSCYPENWEDCSFEVNLKKVLG